MTIDRKKPSPSGLIIEESDSDCTYIPLPDHCIREPREEFSTPDSAMDTDESPPKRPTKKAPSISEIFRANSARTARQKAKERSAHPEHGSNAKAGPSMTSGAPTYLKISIAPRVSQDYQESLDKVVKEGILSLQKQVMNAMLDARNLERERIQSHIADDMNERKEKVDDLINIYLENGIPIPKSFVSEANANFEKKAKEIYLSLKTQAITRKNTLAEKAERKKTAEAENNIQRILQQPENSNNNRNGTVSATVARRTKRQPKKAPKKKNPPNRPHAEEEDATDAAAAEVEVATERNNSNIIKTQPTLRTADGTILTRGKTSPKTRSQVRDRKRTQVVIEIASGSNLRSIRRQIQRKQQKKYISSRDDNPTHVHKTAIERWKHHITMGYVK